MIDQTPPNFERFALPSSRELPGANIPDLYLTAEDVSSPLTPLDTTPPLVAGEGRCVDVRREDIGNGAGAAATTHFVATAETHNSGQGPVEISGADNSQPDGDGEERGLDKSSDGSLASAENEPNAGVADKPPTPPPDNDLPVPAENPDDGRSEGERADAKFSAIVETPPSPDELRQLQDKQAAVDWLGYNSTGPSVGVAFGGRDRVAERESAQSSDILPIASLKKIDFQKPDEIVDRQLRRFSDTLTRVQEGVEATRDLRDLAAQHVGRTLIERYEALRGSPPAIYYTEGYHISMIRDGLLVAVRPVHPGDEQPDFLCQRTPSGELHLIARNAKTRFIARVEEGQLAITREEALSVPPEAAMYYKELRDDLAAYENLLVQVAEHAGFNRTDIANSREGYNRDVLLERVDPVVANPDFQDRLPYSLRGELMRQAYRIAPKVNTSYRHPGSLFNHKIRLEVGTYFDLARRMR